MRILAAFLFHVSRQRGSSCVKVFRFLASCVFVLLLFFLLSFVPWREGGGPWREREGRTGRLLGFSSGTCKMGESYLDFVDIGVR